MIDVAGVWVWLPVTGQKMFFLVGRIESNNTQQRAGPTGA